jgi:hypothetical protein
MDRGGNGENLEGRIEARGTQENRPIRFSLYQVRVRGTQRARALKKPIEPEQQQRRQIYHLRGTPPQLFGKVDATTKELAIKKALIEFKVPSKQQKRLRAVWSK